MTIMEKYHDVTLEIDVMFIDNIPFFERRYFATTDIPGADKMVHIRFEGTLAELLVNIYPGLYRKYVFIERGNPVLYAKLAKSLYLTLRAALLFWNNLTQTLIGWGFELNKYDKCVPNKIINGLQCTIVWHVDNLKISRFEKKVFTGIIQKLSTKYGKESALTFKLGKKHNYLGMTIEYSEYGHVSIDMTKYIENILMKYHLKCGAKLQLPLQLNCLKPPNTAQSGLKMRPSFFTIL
jgi:hypothetical protein